MSVKNIISNFKTYFDRLIPNIHKTDILVNTDIDFEELQNIILPMYNCARNTHLQGTVISLSETHFKRLINTYNGVPSEFISHVGTVILNNQNAIEDLIKQDFQNENMKSIMDYHKLNILKYLEAIHFFNEFSRMWINAAVFESTGNKQDIVSPTIKRDISHVTSYDNITAFSNAVNMLNQPLSKFLDSIKALKGHQYSESDWEGTPSNTTDKLDPYKANFVPVTWNPVYLGGLMLNGWRVQRHNRNKAELDRLQLMLQNLEDQKSQTTDEASLKKLEGIINYYSNLSNKYSAEIEKMEGRD